MKVPTIFSRTNRKFCEYDLLAFATPVATPYSNVQNNETGALTDE